MSNSDVDESVCLAFFKANGNSVHEPTNDATTTLPPLLLFAYERGTGSRTNWYVLGAWAKIVASEHMRSMSVLKQWIWNAPKPPTSASSSNNNKNGSGNQKSSNHDAVAGPARINVVSINSDLVFRDCIRDALLLRGVAATVLEKRDGGNNNSNNNKNTGGASYKATQQGSPGLLGDFESLLFDSHLTSSEAMSAVTAAMLVRPTTTTGRYQIALGMASSALRRLWFGEVTDTTMLPATDAVLTQWSVKELFVDAALEKELPDVLRSIQRVVQRGSGMCLRFFNRKELSASIAVPSPSATVVVPRGSASSPAGGAAGGAAAASASAATQHLGQQTVAMRRTVESMLRVPEDAHRLVDTPDALSALNVLIAVAGINKTGEKDSKENNNNNNGRGVYTLAALSPHTLVRLDTAAVDALNIVSRTGTDKITINAFGGEDGAGGGGGGGTKQIIPGSVFGWLNRCATASGSRMMRQWLLQPLRDVGQIYERQACVQALVDIPVLRNALFREVLSKTGNMDSLNRKLQRRTITLKEVHSLVTFCDAVPAAVHHIRQHTAGAQNKQHRRALENNFVSTLEDICAAAFKKLRQLIECTIEIQPETHTAIIAPHFDDMLLETYQELQDTNNKIEKETRRVMKEGGWTEKTLKRDSTTALGVHFRVTRKEDKEVRDNPKMFKVLSTQRDGVRFTTDAMAAINEENMRLEERYQQRQAVLQEKLIETAATYVGPIDEAKELLARLDIFCAWAEVVSSSGMMMCRPKIGGVDGNDPNLFSGERFRRMFGQQQQQSDSQRLNNSSMSNSGGVSPSTLNRVPIPSNFPDGGAGGSQLSAGGGGGDSQQQMLLLAGTGRENSEQWSSTATLELIDVWHPLVQARREYVASSVRLGAAAVAAERELDRAMNNSTQQQQHQQAPPLGWIISGVNMGGKSTFMRSVGIAAVLAHCGCFVPAASADISLLDAVLCRVGATDYLSAGVSTFMAEMLECSSVLNAATENSLVIVDELGRGTSTFDGFGLAWTIAEHIVMKRKSMMLFATHFHEMSHIEATTNGRIRNVHTSAETRGDDLLRFLYRIQPGPSDRSFGVAIARLAGMPPAVVAEAREKAQELEKHNHHQSSNSANNNNDDNDDDAAAAASKKKHHGVSGSSAVVVAEGAGGGFLSAMARTQLLQLANEALTVSSMEELAQLAARVSAVDVGRQPEQEAQLKVKVERD